MKLITKILVLILTVAMSSLVGLSTESASASTLRLRQGASHPAVSKLQLYLDLNKDKDYFSYPTYTSYFGDSTRRALTEWQRATHYRANGTITVGSRQWKQLRHDATRLPVGLDSRTRGYARREGWAVDSSKATRNLYVLHYSKTRKRVIATVGASARYGDDRGSAYVTRNGVHRIFRKGGADYQSTLYHVSMPYPSFFDGGEAIHYSADFARYGYSRASHGCLNLRDLAAAKYVNRLPMQTVVIVHP